MRNKILPFLETIKADRVTKENINMRDIVFFKQTQDYYTPEKLAELAKVERVKNYVLRVYKIAPFNCYFCDEDPKWNSYEFKSKLKVDESKEDTSMVKVEISHYDYTQVARQIELIGKTATMRYSNGYLVEENVSEDLINKAALGLEITRNEVDTFKFSRKVDTVAISGNTMETPLQEADYSKINPELTGVSVEMPTAVESKLRTYLTSSSPSQRVPMLYGPTSVAKSATVKTLCDQLGMRLVDLRVSFMSRLDFEGLTEIIKNGKNSVSYSCPTDLITTCTDAFINFARESIPVIKAKIADPGMNEDEIKELKKALAEFEENAKTPVLFFDEVLRSDVSIRNALIKILNDKSFLGMKMSIARVLTAANHPTDAKPGLEDLYYTGGVEDVAFLDRFEAIAVTPEATLKPWTKWANTVVDGVPNIHNRVMDFLEKNPNYTYDFSEVEAEYEREGDPDKLSTMPFPTYRTWTMVSDYLRNIDTRRRNGDTEIKINPDVILGLIGNKVGSIFLSMLERSGEPISIISDDESLDKFVEDSLDSGVPTMIVGPSSIGKTTRINNYAKKTGAIVIEVNLALVDRVDIMGSPCKVSSVDYVANVGEISAELNENLKEIASKQDLPPQMTVKAPKLQIRQKFIDAMENKQEIIIFIDEMNRCVNQATMSAVFEIISDHRIFGIDFTNYKDHVKVISACNMGENTPDAKALDPAFTARFNIKHIPNYTKSDVKALKKYMQNNDYNRALIDFMDNLKDSEILDFIKRVEERTISSSVPSMRALSDLSRDLTEAEGKDTNLGGTILFPSDPPELFNSINTLSPELLRKGFSTDPMLSKIDEKINNWAALRENVTANVGGQVVPARELVDDWKSLKAKNTDEAWEQIRNLIKVLYSVDSSIQHKREDLIGYTVGAEMAFDFLEHYNKVSGTQQAPKIEIPDLVDPSLIDTFFDRVPLKGEVGVDTTKMGQVTRQIYQHFKNNYNYYYEILQSAAMHLPSTEMRLQYFNRLINTGGDVILNTVNDHPKVGELIGLAGIPITMDEVKTIQDQVRGTGESVSAEPTFLK